MSERLASLPDGIYSLYTTPPAAAVQEGRDWSLLEATQESLREHMAEIKRLKEAQPAPVQEPVRGWWAHTSPITGSTDVQDWQLTEGDKARGWIEREIYTTPPPQRQWVGLSQDELDAMFSNTIKGKKLVNWVAKAIEAKLKQKNTAAQPAVPDAMTSADIQEHIEYVAGWNDCRAEMLKGMKP
jgi:hypothetical protein